MTRPKRGKLWIGTSGIMVPGSKQTFPAKYQDKSRLHYYSSLMNSLEINSSFYKVPMPATFEKWSLDVPQNFRFTIKLWKEITHGEELKNDLDNINLFLSAANRMGNKKGCLLIQFPGKISFDYYNKVEEIIDRVAEQNGPDDWKIAIEFRNASWYVSETFELLDEYGATMVIHDAPKGKNAEVNKSAKFIYIRYHGPKGDYRGSYCPDFLKEQSINIKKWLKSGKDVYAYFNNTIGTAFENATDLKKLVEQ